MDLPPPIVAAQPANPTGPEPAQPATGRLPAHQLVFLIAAGTALVCSFMPWVRVAFISVSGSDGDGRISAVAAALALGLGIARGRVPQRAVLITRLATVSAAIACGVYVYDLVRLSTTRPEANALFDITPSLQLGIVAGAIAAAVATCIGIFESFRRSDAGPWSPSTAQLGVATVAAAGLAVVAAWSLWLLTALIATVLVGLLFASRKRLSQRAIMAGGAVTVLLLAGAVVGAVRNSSSKPSAATCEEVFSDGAAVDKIVDQSMCMKDGAKQLAFTMTTECNDGRSLVSNDYGWGYAGDKWTTKGDAPRAACRSDATDVCDTLFAEGANTDKAWGTEMIECFTDSSRSDVDTVFSSSTECRDGRTLVSNERGWGYTDDKWTTNGDAPIGACRSDATEVCAELFAVGANTQESWGTDIIECFTDASRSDVETVFSFEWPCFDSNKVYISNDRGWGYINEPWHTGEAPSC